VLTAPAGLDSDPEVDDAAPGDEVAGDDPIAADAAGAGPLLALFEVHAPSNASATHAALAAATAPRWR
jgi:hypothetical protein